MAQLTDDEFNERKAQAKGVVNGRTDLKQFVTERALRWINKFQYEQYGEESPSRWSARCLCTEP